ncbi:MAG TPA: SPOR domain-containing protein [Gemmatimonadales bacterium]|nr:SPOR domain-containing protein [Gemmatimonadales bacterium]
MKRIAWLFPLLVAAPLQAQKDPELVRAVRLAQEGSGDSARAITNRWLASVRDTDPKYAEVLYAAAIVAASLRDRRIHLQRIAVEYTGSEWADDALLQLAQLDYAARDPGGTVRQIDRLIGDYPESPLRASAALWGARAAFDVRDRDRACRWSDLGLSAVGEDVELRNQLEFQRERCLAMTREESTAVEPRPAPPAKGWTVQVAAVKTKEEADTEVARIKSADMPSVVVEEGGWFKVRSGPFKTREQAAEAMAQLRKSLGGKPFLVAPK